MLLTNPHKLTLSLSLSLAGFPDYGLYSASGASSDVRGGASYCLADYGSLGVQGAAQILPSDHASSASNSPGSVQHHLRSPEPFKSSGWCLQVT